MLDRLSPKIKKIIFLSCVLLCLMPFVSPPLALLLGFAVAFTIGHPYASSNSSLTKSMLQYAIVGLGFGMNFYDAIEVGKYGVLFTICTIVLTLVLGFFLGRFLNINKNTSFLIAAGTAICGGSAIAAVTPVIDAKEEETSVALVTVFLLNSVGLVLFPTLGLLANLSDSQFGMWAAIAIHDTSSVVGAAQKFGDEALEIAITIKLQRALWIIPLTFFSALLFKKDKKKTAFPQFIFYFILAMMFNTYFVGFKPFSVYIVLAAKRCLVVTLFLIGAGLSKKTLQNVGFKPLLLGVILWILISTISFLTIVYSII